LPLMAGRIPQSFIDDLLDRIDVVEVIDRRVSLKKSGKNFSACCPFHDEKTPSFSVNQEKQFYYCFGCGASGNAIGFLMDYERLDFPRAVENLADAAGLEVPREASAFHEEPQQKRNLYTILEQVADYYCQQLREHPAKQRAIDYLKQRGLSGEIARDFDIGYAPPGWDNLLKALGASDEDKQLLIDGGMLINKEEDNKLYDRFRDRIMFPIRDQRGRVIAFGGRVLGDDKPKYLNSPETPVFHKSKELYGLYQSRKANRHLERLLIVEGYMDVVALSQKGLKWSAATLGTATSTEHLNRVFRQCPEVVFCFDGDEAGRKAAERALHSALPAMTDGRQARFLFLPQGEDPDSLIRQIGFDQFRLLVDKATPLETYLFNSQAEGLDLETMDGKARLSTKAAPLINMLPEGVFKALMLDSLADRTGLSRERLQEFIQPPATEEETYPEPGTDSPAPTYQPKQRQNLPPKVNIHRDPALYAIGLLVLHPQLGSKIEPVTLNNPDNCDKLTLLQDILALTHKRPDANTPMILGNWLGAPWKALIEEAINQAQLFGLNSATTAPEPQQELSDTLNSLSHHHQREQIHRQVDKLLATDYAELSAEDKVLLKALLSEQQSK
jgi:DNA primase